MASCRKLLELPGVVAAGKYGPNGQLLDYAGDINLASAKTAGLMAFANMAMANMQAAGWSDYTGKEGFYPVLGFAVSGPKKSALVVGNVGVFVENDKADFDLLFNELQNA